jgi:precorrin-6B methylase 1
MLVDGKEVMAETDFKATAASGTAAVTFTLSSLSLKGKTAVVFESLEYKGNEIAVHADIEDEGHTVTFKTPKNKTSAAGVGGGKDLDIRAEVTIVDTVSYESLTPDEMYTLKGVLMDKATGKPMLADGKEVMAETDFKVTAASGTAAVTFTLNSLSLKGKTAVVFESLEYKGNEIAMHADIEDGGQTVTFKTPKIKTSAAGADGGKDLDIRAEVTIVDTVSYENLTPDETYTLKGVLMDKATGKPLLIDGKEVMAETAFNATAASGTAVVTFTLNSLSLKGKTAVVFESLEYKGNEIAVHADIEDSGQTVTFKAPKIGTSASGRDGNKIIPLDKNAVVIDAAAYENLTIGGKYTLKGVLMDKETGKPVLVDGKEVTAETVFEAKTVSGTVTVTFPFDSTALESKTLVVFETLVYEGAEIARHTDLADEAQTVTVESKVPVVPDTPAPGNPKTGDDRNPLLWTILLGLSVAGGAAIVLLAVRKRKRIAKNKHLGRP